MNTRPLIDPTDPRLSTLTLASGGHESPDQGMCFMEAVAWLRNSDAEPMDFNDAPRCVAPTIRSCGIGLNDGIKDAAVRTALLKPLIPVVVGTATTAADEQTRAWLATDFLVRQCLPAWLECAGGEKLLAHAANLRASALLTNAEIAQGMQGLLEEAQTDSVAAWDAAGAAKSYSYQVMCDAAMARIKPTADRLNAECADLIRRMAEVGR